MLSQRQSLAASSRYLLAPSLPRLSALRQPASNLHARPFRRRSGVAEALLKKMGASPPGGRGSRSSDSSKASETVLEIQDEQQSQPSQQQQQQQQEGVTKAPSFSADSNGSSAAPAASVLLPIAFAGGAVTVGDGLVLLDCMSPQARVQQHTATSDMVLLSMAASNGATALEDFSLGALHCKSWLCCARNKLWWMTPEWGKTARELPPECQFLLAELKDGSYATILPLISQQKFRGTLRPPKKGTRDHARAVMTLRLESGDDTVKSDYFEDAVLLAAGREPYALIEAAVTAAAALSGGARSLRDKQLPPNLDVFGWCSWDSFYSAVSASGLSDAVQSLASGGTPPRWVVIDDGWQCTEVDEPYRNIPTEQLKQKMLKDRNVGEKPGDAAQREAYLEGEMEALGQAARDVPAGTAMGAYLQEIRASGPPEDDEAPSGVDYHSLARQHAISSSVEEGPASPAKAKAPYRPLVIRASSTIFQYIVGLIFGFFQAFIVIFYQWVVDPAEHGTWPVNLFTYLTTGPLKGSMLQFFADSTNFTRRLTDVKANSKFSSPYATPDDISSGRREDLKAVVDHLRNRFNVDYVYCWHGLSAYWSGVSPDSAAVSKYGPKLHFPKPTPGLSEIEPSTAWNPGILGGVSIANNVDELFSDMHAYLSAAGISGVKVDCQAGVGLVGSALGGGPAAALKAHSALEDSIATHFKDNHAINCMCHSTENIYRWRDTAVARASDDFYPTDRASHIPHLAACAFNGVFLSPLALPDWDMFSSRHVAAEIHATARAVCGGPVYVSDAPGSHAFDVLRRLVLPDGSILRAKLPGRPTRDSLFRDVMRDGDTLLKIWNMNATGGIVGVFNLQGASWDRSRRRFHIHDSTKPELEALVRPTDVEVFRQQLEAAGCDVAGMLAAAAAAAAAEAAAGAQREAKLRQSSSSSSSSSSNSGAKRGSAAQRGSEQSLRVPLLAATRADGGSGSGSLAGSMLGSMDAVSSGSADEDTASSPAGPPSAGVPASASASTSAASTATALGNGAGRRGNNGQPSSSNGNRNGSNGSSGTSSFVSSTRASSSRRSAVSMPGLVAGGGVWDEDEEGGGAPSAAVPDFAVYVGATEELHRVSWDQGVPVSLEGWQGTVVTLAPISRFEYGGSSSHGLEFAAIGLSNMLNGGGAVCSVHAERLSPDGSMTQDTGRDDPPADKQSPEQLLVHLTVRGRGTLLAYSSRRPQSCFVDGFEVAFHHVGERLSVEVPQVGSLHAGRSEQALVISY